MGYLGQNLSGDLKVLKAELDTVQVTLMSAFGLLLVALVPSSVAFAQDTMSNMSGMANETTGNMTGGGNQSEGGSPLSKIPIIGDLLTGGK